MSFRLIFRGSFGEPVGAITITPKVAAIMDIRSLDHTSLLSEILESHPRGPEIVRKYFGEDYLQKGNLRVLSLKMACILRGVNIVRLLDELGRTQADQGA
jgi:hypothetical protein